MDSIIVYEKAKEYADSVIGNLEEDITRIDQTAYGNAQNIATVIRPALNNLEIGKADKATSLAGYGISDAYTKSEVDAAIESEINEVTGNIPTKTSDLTNDSGFLTAHQDISGKENTSNKVTSISASSTNTQYPSAQAVKNYVDTALGVIENGSY